MSKVKTKIGPIRETLRPGDVIVVYYDDSIDEGIVLSVATRFDERVEYLSVNQSNTTSNNSAFVEKVKGLDGFALIAAAVAQARGK